MKKLKMIVTSIIVLAIVGSAFAFNAQKDKKFCTSGDLSSQLCTIESLPNLKKGGFINPAYYAVDWDGASCNQPCTISAFFTTD